MVEQAAASGLDMADAVQAAGGDRGEGRLSACGSGSGEDGEAEILFNHAVWAANIILFAESFCIKNNVWRTILMAQASPKSD